MSKEPFVTDASGDTERSRRIGPNSSPSTLGIVGTGLIGTSLIELNLSEGQTKFVSVFEPNPAHLRYVRERFPDVAVCETLEELATCDLVIVCAPPDATPDAVVTLLDAPNSRCIVVDTASTKLTILNEITAKSHNSQRYIGGHPLAGGNKRGPFNANSEKLSGAKFVIDKRPENDKAAVASVVAYLEQLGLSVMFVSARKHDQLLSMSSHLPHLLGYAYVASVRSLDKDDQGLLADLASKSTKSISYFASENSRMWSEIFDESEGLSNAVDTFLIRMLEIRTLSRQGRLADLDNELLAISKFADEVGLR